MEDEVRERQAQRPGHMRPADKPMTAITFFVPGIPKPAGSKRAFAVRKNGVATGRIAVVDANPNSRDWKNDVRSEALKIYHGPPLCNALTLHLIFFMPRPKSHFRTGKNSSLKKDSSPVYPVTKPDATKLLRGVEDALTGIVWRDDAQIVTQCVMKRYRETPGVQVQIKSA